ncbi:MAG: hypothetical protein KC422_15240 [Trueperaceae bacterium]|nr:hypothetical protein [Trueperaceae bacterium]
MTLSPLIVLILLLFLAATALIFLLWSLLTLRTPHVVINSRRTRVTRDNDDERRAPSPQKQTQTATGLKPSVYNSVVYPQRVKGREEQKSKDELKHRLTNNQVRGLNANPQIPTPNAPPVQAVVTKTHSHVNQAEELEASEAEIRQPRFQVVTTKQETPKRKPESEQVPLFDNMPLPPFQLLDEEEKEEEEDVFERFIRSKNEDLGF